MSPIRTIDRRSLLAGAAAAAVLPLATRAQEASPMASPVAEGDLPLEQICILTGGDPAALNQTGEQWAVYGTDLGSSFLYKGETVLVFGDTFAEHGHDWRSNVIGFSTDNDPSDGVVIDRMIEDYPGHAAEVLPSKKIDNDEMTVIPTYGVAVGNRMFLHYMSVKHWGAPGHWELGSAGFAYSDDDGKTWTKDEGSLLPGDTNWGQVAIVEHEDLLYLYGIPGGRYGGVKLARVAPADLLTLTAWEYWDGAAWVAEEEAAVEIVPPNVGELSVRWNSHYQRWIMMYLIDNEGLIVVRTAEDLTGPWDEPRVAVRSGDFPALYAPYMYPKWNDGPEIYFNMSLFGPYNVFMMKTSLPEFG